MKKFTHPLTNAATGYIAELERHLETYKRMNDATREALDADAEGKGTVESIEALKTENEQYRDALHVLVLQSLSKGTQEQLAKDCPKYWHIVESLRDGE